MFLTCCSLSYPYVRSSSQPFVATSILSINECYRMRKITWGETKQL